LTGGIG